LRHLNIRNLTKLKLLMLLPALLVLVNREADYFHAATKSSADSNLQSGIYGKVPLAFEPNVGQTGQRVRFLARGSDWNVFLTSSEVLVRLETRTPRESHGASQARNIKGTVLSFRFESGNAAQLVGVDELPGKANYFQSKDTSTWKSDVPTYRAVRYEKLYRDIDLVFYGRNGRLEHDFIVAPGGDPDRIQMKIDGAESLHVAPNGDLLLISGGDEYRLLAPEAYQDVNGVRRTIEARYQLAARSRAVKFVVGRYDKSRPLVIDPILSYSTRLGGSAGVSDVKIAVDVAGNVYIAGITQYANFPTSPGAYKVVCSTTDAQYCAGQHLFVTKLNPQGSALVYSTFLGSVGGATIGLTVDISGAAYVTGGTADFTYPVTSGAYDTTCSTTFPCSASAFVTKLNSSGSALAYSTYFGRGTGSAWGTAIAVDSAGSAYITGSTYRGSIPDAGLCPSYSNGSCVGVDGFVAKFSPDGSRLEYSTFLGGGQPSAFFFSLANADYPTGIAVDAQGNAYVTGFTYASDFPTTPGAYRTTAPTQDVSCDTMPLGRCAAIFISKLNSTGTALVYSTYIGGSKDQYSRAIALDSAGNAYIAGHGYSDDFPTTPGAAQPNDSASRTTAFITKLSPGGSSLVYSTYLGGNSGVSAYELAFSIAVNAAGSAYVTGVTASTDFPVTPNAIKPTCNPLQCSEVFITKLAPSGDYWEYSSYIGGGIGYGIALDTKSNAYLTGLSSGADYPVTPGAYQTALYETDHIGGNAFVTKIVEEPAPPTNLIAQAVSSTQINLSWTDVSLNEDLFEIKQSTDGVIFLQIATVPPNTTAYSVSNLQPDTTYYFLVRASNDAGNSSYSNTASATTQPVPQASTTVAVNNATVIYSANAQNITVSAAVSSTSVVNEGTITFLVKDGNTAVGGAVTSAPLTNGATSLTYTLPAGTPAKSYTIAATYSGGPHFNSSTGSGALAVNPAATSTALASSTNPGTSGQPITFTATVTSARGMPTGTVDFKEGTSVLGTVNLSAGVAIFAIADLSDGQHSITAAYNASANFAGSISNPFSQTVLPLTAAGTLDTSFGTSGRVATPFNGNARINALAVQSDGKIVAVGMPTDLAGAVDFALTRYTSDGALDDTFGTGGRVITDFFGKDDEAFGVAIQPDGRTLVVGRSRNVTADFAVARYNPNGTLDNTFGSEGKVTTDFFGASDFGKAIALQPDGKFVVAGYAFLSGGSVDIAVARYNSDGSLDTSFGTSGKAIANFGNPGGEGRAVIIQPDGKIVVAGIAPNAQDFALVRFDSNGALDASFGVNGRVTTDFNGFTDFANALVLQADGKLVAAGFANDSNGSRDIALARYNSNGSLDTSFGAGGKVTTDFFGNLDQANGLALEPSGKILAAGYALGSNGNAFDFGVVRYNVDGSLDSSFGSTGKATTDFYGGVDAANAVVVAGGKIIAAGFAIRSTGSTTVSDFALARYYSTPPEPELTLSATSINFAAQAIGTTSAEVLLIATNTGSATLNISSVATTSQFGVNQNCAGNPVAPSASCTIRLTFAPTAAGAQSGTLQILSNATGSPHTIPLTGTGVGTSQPTVTLSTTTIDFGDRPAFSSVTQSVSLTASAPYALSDISIGGANAGEFQVGTTCPSLPASLAPGEICYIDVTFLPIHAGPSVATLLIADNAIGSPRAIALSGRGISSTQFQSLTPLAAVYSDSAQNISVSATITSATNDPVHGGTVIFRLVESASEMTIGTPVSSAVGIGGVATAVYVLPGGTPGSALPLPPGVSMYQLIATYSGTPDFSASATSNEFFVAAAPTTTTFSISVNPTTFGQATTFSALVSSGRGAPKGFVRFIDGVIGAGATLADVPLSAGQASFTTSALGAGSHWITVVFFSSNGNFGSSQSTLTMEVQKASTSIQLSAQPVSPKVGDTVTFVAKLAAVAPGAGNIPGTVDFYDGDTKLNSKVISITQGSAQFSTSALTKGSHGITAVYSGGANFNGSTSPSLKVQVKP
jgi:uncharacterized delta-60 repeat protein